MLPSMPVLFTRDSQDAFGNKIEPSTSFFGQQIVPIPIVKPVPPPPSLVTLLPPKVPPKESKGKGVGKKKEPVVEEPATPKPNEKKEQEDALVAAYFSKVQSKNASHRVPNNKFVQFKDILKNFDPTKENPIDLYKKIQELFGKEQRELADEFLLFLTAGQAAEIGQFMDHFMLVQLHSFIKLLRSTFFRKPAILRKVIRAITNSLNCGTIPEMKAKVLPHLRSNPRLAHMFRSLFPDERPPDSVYENGTDTIHESFLTDDKGFDVWTFDDQTGSDRRRNLRLKQGLDTVYLQNRVFLQHGKNLRPARVTFPYSKEPYRVHARRLAPHTARLSPSPSDDEASPKKKNPPKRTRKAPAKPKNVKDVNDNTKCNTESPKTKRTQSKRKKEDTPKREKKVNDSHKREEASKAKQARIEAAEAKREKVEVKSVEKDVKTIDNGVKSVEKDVKCVEKDAKSVEKDVKSVDKDIKSVEKDVSSVEKDVKSVEKDVKSNHSWTRDEDKTMLEVLKGEAVTDEVFERISLLLPHRSVSDIKDRFFQVMTLLQQMAVGEVT